MKNKPKQATAAPRAVADTTLSSAPVWDDATWRRKRILKALVLSSGGNTALGQKAGRHDSFISHGCDAKYAFGSLAARRLAIDLRLDPLYFERTENDPESAGAKHHVPLVSWATVGRAPVGQTEVIPCPWPVSGAALALVMEGDSMQGGHMHVGVPRGYIVIVDPAQEARPNGLVVAWLDGVIDAMCRQIVREGGSLYLQALDARYRDLIKVGPGVHLVGPVIGALAKL